MGFFWEFITLLFIKLFLIYFFMENKDLFKVEWVDIDKLLEEAKKSKFLNKDKKKNGKRRSN